jgi:hypothetical protein
MLGYSPTQGHIASAIPFLGHAVDALRAGTMQRAMFLAKGSLFLTVFAVSWAQFGWITEFGYNVHDYATHFRVAFIVGLAASAVLFALRRLKILESQPDIVDLFMPVSVLAGFLPFLMPHPHMAVAGAAVFMAYWAMVGWTGLRLGTRWVLNAAVIIIALRLVIVYVEVFGNLLSTGIGLIVSGALLIALVWGTQKLIKKLGQRP